MICRSQVITGESLRGEVVENMQFEGCRLAGANLKFTAFTRCIFNNCDFSGVILNGTSFEDCSFAGSKLSNLDFVAAHLIKCDFREVVMENSILQRVKTGTKDELIRYDLRECKFARATLSNTVWVKCDLEMVDFAGANLTGAIFDRCKLTKAKFVGAQIAGTSFEKSIIDHTELDYQGFVQFGNSRGFVIGN